jgi:hypothetical protein
MMQPVDAGDFITHMRAVGLASTDAPSHLSFERSAETDRFWLWPWPPHELLGLLTAIFQHVVPDRYCDAWRPGGVWHEPDPSFIDTVREQLLSGFAIPREHPCALRFARSEFTELAALLLAFAIGGWNVDDDIVVVPDHARYLVRLSHHAVVHVQCRDPESVEPLVTHMRERGWELPTEVPDATFKVPAWMGGD